jgi:glycosyltransferase involved in cell wall biosynthesis
MKIAIDGNEANIAKRVGVNQFAFEVIWGIYNLVDQGKYKKHNFEIFLHNQPQTDLPPECEWWKYKVFGPNKLWTLTGLPIRLFREKNNIDVLYSPSHYGPAFSPIPFVCSIMDLGFLKWPEQFTKKDFYQLKYWTKWSIKRAKKLIAISEFTKKDIVKKYFVNPSKVIVAYPGYKKSNIISNENVSIDAIKKKYGVKKPYILYLGTLKPSKNIEGLINAYSHLPAIKEKYNLVIVGKKGWLFESIFSLVKKLNLEKKIIFTDFIPDEETGVLMKEASVFVMPSFWEGFGIPVLEAMEAGTPLVCSNQGSLPEIVKGSGLLVDPYKPKDIAKGLEKILNNKKLRDDLVKKGRNRAKDFSWERCSRIILDTLCQVKN